MPAELYLIPVTLGESALTDVIPSLPLAVLQKLDHFVVEDLRSARRYLRKAGMKRSFDDIEFYLLNEHSDTEDIEEMVQILIKGHSMGILPEAGLPAIADPGAKLVAAAHRHGIRVIPMVGPSSILLALMASGMNGQRFRFHGYLPVKGRQRQQRLRQIENAALETGETQIFMETPYRNKQLLDDILGVCRAKTLLCIAADISLQTESIQTRTVGDWQKDLPSLHKRPAIFLLNRE